MGSIAFDTLGASKALQQNGFSREQAEAIAELQRSALEQFSHARELATKQDIARLNSRIMETQRQITEAILQSQRYMTNLMLTLDAVIVAAIGIAVALLK